MGVWGTAIFSDDTARDVREDYRDHLGDGLGGPEATKRLLKDWSSSLKDPDEAPVFWLALAATQWKCGRLEASVLEQALEIIDGGSDLARWEADSHDRKKREAVLQKLRVQLEPPQPAEKKIPRRFRDSTEWLVGDLVAYSLLSGRNVILRVIGHHTDKGGTSPICELLDWIGKKPPARLRLRFLSIRKTDSKAWSKPQFMLGRIKALQRPDDRLMPLGINLKPSQTPGSFVVLNWKQFDQTLKETFGFE
jgi:hypothetical protein